VAKGGLINPAAALSEATRFADLRQRFFFLIGALVVYRIGTFIPVPGIDPQALQRFFEQQSGTILSMFNMFSGGALERMSMFALGVMPYISASIILQMASVVVPSLNLIKKEGEAGRRKIMQWTRYGTVLLAGFQSVGAAVAMQNQGLVISPGFNFVFTAMVTLVTGTIFLMWLGEQITERGIGNGISMIILASIVSGLPSAIGGTLELVNTGEISAILAILLVLLVLGVTGAVVFMERGQRRIPVHYAKRQQGRRLYAGQATHLPFKINMSGVIPPIFASSIILFPATIANWLRRPVRGADPVLLLLLYRARLRFARDRRQPEALRGLSARHPSRAADRGVHRPGIDAAHLLGRPVHHGGVPAAAMADHLRQGAVLFRRHLAPHHRGEHHGLHVPASGSHDVAPVQGPAGKG
jgi:preprotein translocase subunit SecY